MVLIVGGAAQGKREYARAHAPEELILDHLEGWVRARLEEGKDPWQALQPLLEEKPGLVILCDEVGCGVVPVDRDDRRWREAVGRLCCRLAEEAEAVVRLFCGIPTLLKGAEPWR